MRQITLIKCQYFWDFNNCPGTIFSQLGFENVWLYFLDEVTMTQNYYKSYLRDSQQINFEFFAPWSGWFDLSCGMANLLRISELQT